MLKELLLLVVGIASVMLTTQAVPQRHRAGGSPAPGLRVLALCASAILATTLGIIVLIDLTQGWISFGTPLPAALAAGTLVLLGYGLRLGRWLRRR